MLLIMLFAYIVILERGYYKLSSCVRQRSLSVTSSSSQFRIEDDYRRGDCWRPLVIFVPLQNVFSGETSAVIASQLVFIVLA